MAMDTVTAILRTPTVAGVVVVTADEAAHAAAVAVGAHVIADVPDSGLNPALAYAATQVRATRPEAAIAVLTADLPALRPAELAEALTAAWGPEKGTSSSTPPADRAFVADSAGTGTVLLTASTSRLGPRFGPGSAEQHLTSGAIALTGPWPSLRGDVDTPADFTAAAALGLGSRTSALRETMTR